MRKGLPKKYAKLGFKKGWQAYKKAKKKPSSRSVSTMARKRVYKRKAKAIYRRAKSGLTFNNAKKVLIGAGLCAVYEVVVSPMIPVDAMMKNIVELGVGLFLVANPKLPMSIRAFGGALATINAYSIITPYVQNFYAGTVANDSY